MKGSRRIALHLFLVLMTLPAAACAISAPFFATPTSTPTATPTSTPTPTATPTRTPTVTPTPSPDLSSAVLTTADLPAVFEELSLADLGINPADFSTEGYSPGAMFMFMNPKEFQIVFGMNLLLDSSSDRVLFDASVSDPDVFLPQVVASLGTQRVRNQKILKGLEDIGDTGIAATMVADLQGVPMQIDVVSSEGISSARWSCRL